MAMGVCCLVSMSMVGCSGSSTPAADTMPDMKGMEKAMMEAGTPGAMHKELMSHAGTWDGKVKMWMAPGAPAEESTCTTVNTTMMDGRFLRGETRGNMLMGGQTMPFEGFGVYGYNNTTGNFESTWCDNMGTMQMNFTGKMSPDHKKVTWESHFFCPIMKKTTWMREVETMNGPDSMTLEMYGPDMQTGKEMKMMEIQYTRKPGWTR
jgi:hypothetical protein